MHKTPSARKISPKKLARINQAFQAAYAQEQQGNLAEAIGAYQQILKTDPNNAAAAQMLGLILHKRGENIKAEPLLAIAAKDQPGFAHVQCAYATALSLNGFHEKSISYFKRAIDLEKHVVSTHYNLALVYKHLGRWSEAIETFQACIALNPNMVAAHLGLGLCYVDTGNVELAKKNFTKALSVNPSSVDALQQLALHTTFTQIDPVIDKMEALYQTVSKTERMTLAFALGKAFEDLQDFKKSFQYMSEANRLMRATVNYQADQTPQAFNFVKEKLHSGVADFPDTPIDSNCTPIFIIGMPRSGTSLAEQILASHSKVYGAGELTNLSRLNHDIKASTGLEYPLNILSLDADDASQYAHRYLEELISYAGGETVICDKMPQNFLFLGLIVKLFPNAKIIHCLRDPIDTCFSIYKSWFGGSHAFAYNMKELGLYYREYSALMTHWETLFKNKIHNVIYEDMVNSTETEIGKMLDYCDLDFEENCLAFYKTERPVSTLSTLQVRQPIYKSSIMSWKHYEQELQPLISALNLS